MSTSQQQQQQNEHLAPVTGSMGSGTAWYSRSAFLVPMRVVQFASAVTTLGLLAYLLDQGDTPGFELAVSVISVTYLIVVAAAPLSLNLYSMIAVSIFETTIFALWVGASATLGKNYGDYSCTFNSPDDDDDDYYYYSWWGSYLSQAADECKIGKASIALAAFSAFLSLCAFFLLCANVLIPMKAVYVGEMNAESNRAHLSRFTALAITYTSPLAGDLENAGPVDAEAAEPVVLVDAETAQPAVPVTAAAVQPAVPETA